MQKYSWILLAVFLFSCEGSTLFPNSGSKKRNEVGDYLSRSSNDYVKIPPQRAKDYSNYFFETKGKGNHPYITKEYFRCKGFSLNPPRSENVRGEVVKIHDCSGKEKHSLSLRDGKEFIYPVLLDILNFIQDKTGKKVVITSGYRCPEHNNYVDSSPLNQVSKHQIGAEVDFYVQGMENKPLEVVSLILAYYQTHPKYKSDKELNTFKRYEKKDVNTALEPFMNKEIFVKVFSEKEGRNFDNRHLYPYLSIQVRYDLEKKERVNYSWDLAFRGYKRY